MATKRKAQTSKKAAPKTSNRKKTTPKKAPAKAPSGLPWDHERFCLEYVIDHNGTRAAKRAGYSEKTAGSQAHRLLKNAEIVARIADLEREVARKLNIEHADVLNRYWQTATGDVNDLVQARRECCRYCHGIDHEYQWTTEREFRDARDRAVLDMAGDDHRAILAVSKAVENGEPIAGLPTDAGGYGYKRTEPPHPGCPECDGEGHLRIFVADTRDAVSHPLYDGVKQTKDGIEVKIADRQKALEHVARHLSFFKDKVEVDASEELIAAARRINAEAPPMDANYMAANADRLGEDDD